jgi:hypothetical protein
MKAQTSWRVVVIVEDDSDGRALRTLAGKCGFAGVLDWLPANGIGNIKRKGQTLIDLARTRLKEEPGCVAVVVDGDGKDPGRDEPHKTISALCRRAKVPFVVACQAVEAWLLADAGVADWLGRSPARRPDTLKDPKREITRAFRRRTGRTYGRRIARAQVAEHADGTAATHSASLRTALTHMDRSGCRDVGK